jgi:hypothetical protein
MSITLKNKTAFDHETAKANAMANYPYGHPSRYAIWQEFDIQVPGAESFGMSEFVIMAIWSSLKDNGWPEATTMFPCSGMKRLALISALERLQDCGVKTAEEVASEMGLLGDFGFGQVSFNTQKVEDALEELIAFLYRNEEVFN